MTNDFDETMLRRALRVAMNGRGHVEPNPMVGCVLVKNHQIIAEGWHTHFGGPHAEPTTLADCRRRGNDPRGATAYVTLEPCCHTNKKTPPCAPRLIEAGIARVVIGCLDPNPEVNGNGMLVLEKHAIDVDIAEGQVADECRQLIAPFRKSDLYLTMKWAQSADGFVAGPGGKPVAITSTQANLATHRLRTRSDGIAVSVNTVINDDPSLTVRNVEVIRRPLRIVLDRHFRVPLSARLFTTENSRISGSDVYVLIDDEEYHLKKDKRDAIWDAGGEAIGIDGFFNNSSAFLISGVLDRLASHLLIESGPTLARALLPVTDRLWVYTSSTSLAFDPSAPRAATVPASFVESGRLLLGPDTLVEYLNRDASSFVTATPSADFVLESEIAAQSGTSAVGP